LGAATRRSPEKLAEEQAGARYSDLKEAATEAVIERLSPIQERYAELTQHPDEVQRLLADGAERASAVAEVVVGAARTAMGLTDRAT
jgi:tryptophanyl-tRNA synthetase